VAGHPNVNLFEFLLQPILEQKKKLPVCRNIFHIDENPNEVVVVNFALLMPLALNCLGFSRGGAEPPPQFDERVCDQAGRDLPAVIKPPRQPDFVSTEGNAHR
jgi:hypothetical protein